MAKAVSKAAVNNLDSTSLGVLRAAFRYPPLHLDFRKLSIHEIPVDERAQEVHHVVRPLVLKKKAINTRP